MKPLDLHRGKIYTPEELSANDETPTEEVESDLREIRRLSGELILLTSRAVNKLKLDSHPTIQQATITLEEMQLAAEYLEQLLAHRKKYGY